MDKIPVEIITKIVNNLDNQSCRNLQQTFKLMRLVIAPRLWSSVAVCGVASKDKIELPGYLIRFGRDGVEDFINSPYLEHIKELAIHEDVVKSSEFITIIDRLFRMLKRVVVVARSNNAWEYVQICTLNLKNTVNVEVIIDVNTDDGGGFENISVECANVTKLKIKNGHCRFMKTFITKNLKYLQIENNNDKRIEKIKGYDLGKMYPLLEHISIINQSVEEASMILKEAPKMSNLNSIAILNPKELTGNPSVDDLTGLLRKCRKIKTLVLDGDMLSRSGFIEAFVMIIDRCKCIKNVYLDELPLRWSRYTNYFHKCDSLDDVRDTTGKIFDSGMIINQYLGIEGRPYKFDIDLFKQDYFDE